MLSQLNLRVLSQFLSLLLMQHKVYIIGQEERQNWIMCEIWKEAHIPDGIIPQIEEVQMVWTCAKTR